MLQRTIDTLIKDIRLRPDAWAFDPETGANFSESRGQYLLVIDEPYWRRHWSKRSVTFEDALQRAQKALDKLVAQSIPDLDPEEEEEEHESRRMV